MSIAEELERLQALRDRGTISDDEFARAKAQVLGEPASSRSAATDHFYSSSHARAATASSVASAVDSATAPTCRPGPGA